MFRIKLLIFCAILVQSLPAQWLERKSGLPDSFNVSGGCVIEPVDSLTAFATVRNGKIYKTTDAGLNWIDITSSTFPSHIRVEDMSAIKEDSIWICGVSFDTTITTYIYASFDGGELWVEQYLNAVGGILYFMEMFSKDNGMAMGCSYSSVLPLPVLQTTNAGVQWIEKNHAYLIHGYGVANCIDMVNMQTAFFQKKWSTLYKSSDGGISWDSVFTPYIHGETINFYNEQYGLLVTLWGQIYRSVDGGTSWTEISDLPFSGTRCIEFLPGNPGKIWLSLERNLFFSEDSAETWTEYLFTGDFLSYDIDFVDERHGWIMAENMVYYTKTGNRIVTGLRSKLKNQFDFKLAQNYPNPFNSNTTISYSIPKPGNVNLKVYTIHGKKVTTLLNKYQKRGSYSIEFNADNLSSGIYIFRLNQNNNVESRKMILLR